MDDRLEARQPRSPRASPRLQPAGDPAPFERARRARPTSASALVAAYTGLAPRAARCRAPRRSTAPAWIDANLALAARRARPGRREGSAEGVGPARRRRRRRRGRGAGRRGRRGLGLPRRARARPVRVPGARPRRARAAAVRRAEPRPRGDARSTPTPDAAAALGRAARDHARAAVRRRAVAARRTSPAWCASCSARSSVDPRQLLRLPDLDDLRGLVDTRPRGRPRDARASAPSGARCSTRMQAFMAVLEGYAEHVMDAVGADVLDDLPRAARARSSAAARDRSGLLRLLERLIGMDMKLRQYEQGKRFCDARRRARPGSTALNRVWEGPTRCRRSPSSTTPPRWLRAHRGRRVAADRRSERLRPPVGAPRAVRHTVAAANTRSVCHKVRAGLPRCSRGIRDRGVTRSGRGLQTCVRWVHCPNGLRTKYRYAGPQPRGADHHMAETTTTTTTTRQHDRSRSAAPPPSSAAARKRDRAARATHHALDGRQVAVEDDRSPHAHDRRRTRRARPPRPTPRAAQDDGQAGPQRRRARRARRTSAPTLEARDRVAGRRHRHRRDAHERAARSPCAASSAAAQTRDPQGAHARRAPIRRGERRVERERNAVARDAARRENVVTQQVATVVGRVEERRPDRRRRRRARRHDARALA